MHQSHKYVNILLSFVAIECGLTLYDIRVLLPYLKSNVFWSKPIINIKSADHEFSINYADKLRIERNQGASMKNELINNYKIQEYAV